MRVKKEREVPEDVLRRRAERKIRNKTGVLWTAALIGSYLIINAFLIAIWALSGSEYPWFVWVLLVWGGALAFHFSGYVVGFRFGASRERMVQERMGDYRRRHDAGVIESSPHGRQVPKGDKPGGPGRL